MPAAWQTPAALALVAAAAAFLVRGALRRRRRPGCSSGACGAVSPEVKRLRASLRERHDSV
jgi:hypothetical protein